MSRPDRLNASQQPIYYSPNNPGFDSIDPDREVASQTSERVDKNLAEAEILVPVRTIRRIHNIIKPLLCMESIPV
jgi:hypothetical protein